MKTLKRAMTDVVDSHRERTIALADDLFAHPELGFREHRTAEIVADTLQDLGLNVQTGLAMTGVRTVLDSGRDGPTVAVLAELDGIRVPAHPQADPQTHAAHACGHHAQIAAMLAAARALVDTDAISQLHGRIVLMAVPAEEYGDMAFRLNQVREGRIRFLGGKSELIRIGAFDDVDLAFMIHTAVGESAGTRSSMNGFVAKQADFIGSPAHAGCAPHAGVNAWNAATLALQAIHMQRETMKDDDHVRIHTILHHGGTAVNVVPPNVTMEMQVRAAQMDAVQGASRKVDRALRAGAMAVGADLRIRTLPGYLPLDSCAAMNDVFKAELHALSPDLAITHMAHRCSSTDMGDVSQIMPAIHPHIGGAVGTAHGADYRIENPDLAYLLPAKTICACLCALLADGAAEAKSILEANPPAMTKDDYLALMENCLETTFAYATR